MSLNSHRRVSLTDQSLQDVTAHVRHEVELHENKQDNKLKGKGCCKNWCCMFCPFVWCWGCIKVKPNEVVVVRDIFTHESVDIERDTGCHILNPCFFSAQRIPTNPMDMESDAYTEPVDDKSVLYITYNLTIQLEDVTKIRHMTESSLFAFVQRVVKESLRVVVPSMESITSDLKQESVAPTPLLATLELTNTDNKGTVHMNKDIVHQIRKRVGEHIAECGFKIKSFLLLSARLVPKEISMLEGLYIADCCRSAEGGVMKVVSAQEFFLDAVGGANYWFAATTQGIVEFRPSSELVFKTPNRCVNVVDNLKGLKPIPVSFRDLALRGNPFWQK